MRLRLAAASLAAAALLASAPSLASAKTSARITIQTEADGFSGFVKSSARSCHSGRRVTLYRKVAGPDKKAGSDTAQPNQDGSQWKISVSRDGSYYAVVSATRKCSAAKSATKRSQLSDDSGEGASAAQADGPTASRLRISRGRPSGAGVAAGIINSADPDCITGRTILVYRTHITADRKIAREERVGKVIAKPKAPGSSTYAKFTFTVSRSGYLSFSTAATDACGAAMSPRLYISRPDRTMEGASAAQGDGPAQARALLRLRADTDAYRDGVTALLASPNADCVKDRKVIFYRQRVSASGTVLQEQRIGYSIAEVPDGASGKKSRTIKFKLSRSGPVIAKVLATEDCAEKRSNVVKYKRPTG